MRPEADVAHFETFKPLRRIGLDGGKTGRAVSHAFNSKRGMARPRPIGIVIEKIHLFGPEGLGCLTEQKTVERGAGVPFPIIDRGAQEGRTLQRALVFKHLGQINKIVVTSHDGVRLQRCHRVPETLIAILNCGPLNGLSLVTAGAFQYPESDAGCEMQACQGQG